MLPQVQLSMLQKLHHVAEVAVVNVAAVAVCQCCPYPWRRPWCQMPQNKRKASSVHLVQVKMLSDEKLS